MKIAIAGKGGVGKSTIVSLFARVLMEMGENVIVIDADPDMNLAGIFGIKQEITPIIELKELIAERTGTEPGKSAQFFKMNPHVSDIPDKYSIEYKGIKLLTMGYSKNGGAGCACPENAFLKSLISHILLNRNEWIILDMEAGIEHLGRGTVAGVDKMIVVVEPSKASFETAYRIKKMASDLKIKEVSLIANKIETPEEEKFIKINAHNLNVTGYIGYSTEIKKINLGAITTFEVKGKILVQIKNIIKSIADL